MKLKYTPATVSPKKNQWEFIVNWMSGDADHYEPILYKYKDEESFIKGMSLFRRIIDFKRQYHNLFCDVTSHNKAESIINRHKSWPACQQVINDLFEGHPSFRKLLETYGFEPEQDITCDGRMACPDSIKEMNYWNEHGQKFNITIEK